MPNTQPHHFFTRQPITNAKQVVVGYALSELPQSAKEGEWPLGALDVYLPCTCQQVASGSVPQSLPAQVVLVVQDVSTLAAQDVPTLALALQAHSQQGLRFVLDATALQSQYAALLPGAQVLATGVESAAQFQEQLASGAKLFQGSWVARPTVVKNRATSPGQANVLQLINLVRNKASVDEMEVVLKRDAMLGFKLMRLINSSGFGRTHEVASFRHAVMLLGLDRMFRWGALLLTAANAGGAPAVVGATAVVRARMMELLAEATLGAEEAQNAFTVGLFSLLDDMLGLPIEQALALLPLPPAINEALRYGSGTYGPLLTLAKACEDRDKQALSAAAGPLHLSPEQVNQAHWEALAWAAQLEL